MAGTPEGGKKAAETRKKEDPEAFKKMGEQGGKQSHGGTHQASDKDKKNKDRE